MRAILDAARFAGYPPSARLLSVAILPAPLFLVQSGRARYCHLTKKGELVVLAQLVPGDVIGLLTLLKSPSTYMATAEAASDCELSGLGSRPSYANSCPSILNWVKMGCVLPLATCGTTSSAMLVWLQKLPWKGSQRPY